MKGLIKLLGEAYLFDFILFLIDRCNHTDPETLFEHLLSCGCLTLQYTRQPFLIGVMSP